MRPDEANSTLFGLIEFLPVFLDHIFCLPFATTINRGGRALKSRRREKRAGRHDDANDQTRRFLRGRQPLCGIITSRIEVIMKPAACRALEADSRPEPGPQTSTSSDFHAVL